MACLAAEPEDNAGVDAISSWNYRITASIPASAATSRLMATFHNYEPWITPSHGNGAQRALEMIGVDRHLGIAEEHLQADAPLARILKRLTERVSW